MQAHRTVVGVDTAKRVFQLHWVELETGEMVDLRLSRAKFLEHFANRAACLVGMEACGGAQHWARRLRALGHEVRLLPAKLVRPFVSGNKNDVHDARAIWMAVQQPGIKTVAVKSEAQQAVLALHRMRQQLVKFRTAQINGLRGLLAEYGEVMPRGRAGMRRDMAAALARVSERLPGDGGRDLARAVGARDPARRRGRRDRAPAGGVAPAQRGQPADCGGPRCRRAECDRRGCDDGRSGRLPVRAREFAAWLGLVPRHTGTGGRVRMLGISKRGDTYLRTLLIHGARSVLINAKAPTAWRLQLAKRRPPNVVAVALANKTARTIWALLAHDREYEPNFTGQPA